MLQVALRRPDLIKSLMGIAVAPDFIEYLMAHLPETLKTIYKATGSFVYPTPLNPDGWILTKSFIEDGLKNCLLKETVSINKPVCLMHGYEDSIIPWTTSKILMDKLTTPTVHLHVIKDGDHSLNRPQDLELIVKNLISLISEEKA